MGSEGVEQGWVREKSRVWCWVREEKSRVGFRRSRAGLGLGGEEQGWVRKE